MSKDGGGRRGALSPEAAQALVVGSAAVLAAEEVALGAAIGRALAEAVVSELPRPQRDQSAMDGFAVRASDVTPERALRVLDEATVRDAAASGVASGTAVRISTGAAIPAGADAVVPIEVCRVASDGSTLVIDASVVAGDHIRRAGEELRAGQTVLDVGTTLGPAAIGLLGALGRSTVRVTRVPRVAVIVTGEEFTGGALLHAPGGGDANGPMLDALCRRAGAPVVSIRHVGDRVDALVEAIREVLPLADVALTTGGASAGPHDHVVAAWHEVGVTPLFHAIAMKPGKPTHAGVAQGPHGRVHVIALPGNPLAVLTSFELLVEPLLGVLGGHGSPTPIAEIEATVRAGWPSNPRAQLLRAAVAPGADGWVAEIFEGQGSGMLIQAATSPWVLRLRAGESVAAGQRVTLVARCGAPWPAECVRADTAR